MLIHTDVCLQQLAEEGRSFKWARPICSCGKGKVWGHGWRCRYLGSLKPLELRRFRCTGCRHVFTMTPRGFYPRFQTRISTIVETLRHRLTHRRWPPPYLRQRFGHWLRRFTETARSHFAEFHDHVSLLQFLSEREIFLFT